MSTLLCRFTKFVFRVVFPTLNNIFFVFVVFIGNQLFFLVDKSVNESVFVVCVFVVRIKG